MNWQQMAACAAAGAVGAVVALIAGARAGAYVLAESEARMSEESGLFLAEEAARRAGRRPW